MTVSIKQYNGETQVHIQLTKTNKHGFKTFMVRGINPAQIEDFKSFAERQVDINGPLLQRALSWNDLPDGDAKRTAWNKLNTDWLNAFKRQAKKTNTSGGLFDLPARNKSPEFIIKEFFE
jgi:hypothetical protein